MGETIGDLVPLAITIAVSPVPVIAAILMLLSAGAGRAGIGFLFGWLAGIVAATALFAWLASVTGLQSSEESSAGVSWVRLALGAVLLALAVRRWRSRPAPGTETPLPGWMSAIDRFTAGKGAVLAFALAAVNPKNLAMCVAAGVALADSGLGGAGQVAAGAVFTAIAASTVAVPAVGYAVAREAVRGPLDRLRAWLQAENAAIMSVLLLVIGAVLLGEGIGGLF